MKRFVFPILIGLTCPLMSKEIQISAPTSFNEVVQPIDYVNMPEEYAASIARMAYIWGWPMVNQFNRRDRITQVPYPALNGGILPVAPKGQLAMLSDYIKPSETFVTCPNQDVVYGLGFYSLDEEPIVIQVPDFGERFWVYAMYDARTDQFANIGKQYGTKKGFYLIVGPNWKGDTPEGIAAIIRSPTEFANFIPRVFMDDTKEDREAIQPFINQIVSYPLSEFTGHVKSINYSKLPSIGETASGDGSEIKWVIPEKFFDQLVNVLEKVPPLPGEETLYSQFNQLLSIAKKDPKIKLVLIAVAKDTEINVIKSFFQWKHNGTNAGNNWNRSVNNAQYGIDYFNRTATAKSNMFENKPNETQYFYTDFDVNGTQLNGQYNYIVTFPKGQLPPVKGFWSLTLYNFYHMFSQNSLNRFSLGTKNKNLQFNPDGSLSVYVGSSLQDKSKESNWLPAPKGNFSLYIRAYWGEQEIFNGSWLPPKIEKVIN